MNKRVYLVIDDKDHLSLHKDIQIRILEESLTSVLRIEVNDSSIMVETLSLKTRGRDVISIK